MSSLPYRLLLNVGARSTRRSELIAGRRRLHDAAAKLTDVFKEHNDNVMTLEQWQATQEKPQVFGPVSSNFLWWLRRHLKYYSMDKHFKTLLLKSASQLHNDCANKYPYKSLIREFELPDLYDSWFRLTLLHMWMLLCRLQQSMNVEEYCFVMGQLTAAFTTDYEERLKKVKKDTGNAQPITKKVHWNLHAVYVLTIHSYDEGFFGDDRLLADAVWNCFYLGSADTPPEHINRVVRYMRATMSSLAKIDCIQLLTDGIDRWEVAEEIAKSHRRTHFGIPSKKETEEIQTEPAKLPLTYRGF